LLKVGFLGIHLGGNIKISPGPLKEVESIHTKGITEINNQIINNPCTATCSMGETFLDLTIITPY